MFFIELSLNISNHLTNQEISDVSSKFKFIETGYINNANTRIKNRLTDSYCDVNLFCETIEENAARTNIDREGFREI